MQTARATRIDFKEVRVEEFNMLNNSNHSNANPFTQRITRLNKTLLLLSKIENEQFLEKEHVRIAPLAGEILLLFEDQREALHINAIITIHEDASVYGNGYLLSCC